MESVKIVLESIFSLYTKLCNVENFTQETHRDFYQQQGDLQHIGTTLNLSPGQSQVHFQRLLTTQGRLVEVQAQDANIWSTLISIQSMLTSHMEVLHKELAYAETLMKKDSHLSTHDGLVDLATQLDI